VIEICGMLFLYLSWRGELPPQQRFYFALFHSISAFCNAGFSTFSDSLAGFAASMRINLIFCSLIIFGGIGFGTLRNLGSFVPLKSNRETVPHLSVQTKLILITTACLLVLGFVLFFSLEQNHVLGATSLKEKILGAFFQSVTFRTAGFNTVDFSALRDSTLMLAIFLMFIGAAPGSTGGGIKVTTIAMLFGTVFAIARGRSRVELFRRTIPAMVFYQTIVVITMYLMVALVVCFLLTLTESQQRPIELAFETVSALATVGLTTGVTPELSRIGRILIIIAMFLGRIGPFTLALAIGQRQQSERYRYPEERVQIG
jgi:trk system potassium uptake protein TrkH